MNQLEAWPWPPKATLTVLGPESAGVGIHLVARTPVPVEVFEDEALPVVEDGHLPVA